MGGWGGGEFSIEKMPLFDFKVLCLFNPTALRKAKTLWSFGLSERNRIKMTDEIFPNNTETNCYD